MILLAIKSCKLENEAKDSNEKNELEVEKIDTDRGWFKWYKRLKAKMTAALGEHTSSIQSQLVGQQKISQAKMHDHHKQRMRLAEKQAAAAVKMLNGQFRLEKLQLVEKFKIQRRQEAAEEAEAQDLDVGMRPAAGRKMSLFQSAARAVAPAALERQHTASSAAWQAPKRFGQEEGEGDHGPIDSVGMLLRLLWLDETNDVLRSVLRQQTSRRLFTRFIEGQHKRDLIGLTLWLQVQQCKLNTDPEMRRKEAVQLHDAHWDVGSEVKSNSVDGDEALELLDQRAEGTLARLQTKWLPGFLEEHGERFAMTRTPWKTLKTSRRYVALEIH